MDTHRDKFAINLDIWQKIVDIGIKKIVTDVPHVKSLDMVNRIVGKT